MRQVYKECTCGGGASLNVEYSDTTGVTECACGKMLLWSGEAEKEPQVITAGDVGELPALGLSVGDDVQSRDKFGG